MPWLSLLKKLLAFTRPWVPLSTCSFFLRAFSMYFLPILPENWWLCTFLFVLRFYLKKDALKLQSCNKIFISSPTQIIFPRPSCVEVFLHIPAAHLLCVFAILSWNLWICHKFGHNSVTNSNFCPASWLLLQGFSSEARYIVYVCLCRSWDGVFRSLSFYICKFNCGFLSAVTQ